ncbi:MAG: energy transducer TonB [Acidobacteriota bacterium]|nr:energy transducer TonB [Acidobacteriota bacterium]
MPGIIPPGYARTPQPNYPEAARKRGEEGDVLLKVEVLANGRVGQTEIAESSGFVLLDEAALKTVRNWQFRPARKGRENVACWVNIPVKFKLR